MIDTTHDAVGRQTGYEDNSARARAAAVCLLLAAAVDLFNTGTDLFHLGVLHRIADGVWVSDSVLTLSDGLFTAGGVLQFAIFVVTGILFIRWFHRAYGNLQALDGSPPKLDSSWAIASWFVPFLNLVRPYQMARETWVRSHAVHPAESPGYGLVALWWFLYLASSIGSTLAARLPTTGVGDFIAMSWIFVAADLMSVGAALAARTMLLRIDRVQTRARTENAFA